MINPSKILSHNMLLALFTIKANHVYIRVF